MAAARLQRIVQWLYLWYTSICQITCSGRETTHLLINDKALYRKIAQIALPVALQNLIIFGISMANTVMIGMLGELELSAAAMANQLTFLVTLSVFGLASGANVLIAQLWGKGDTASIHKVLTLTYRVLAVGCLLYTLVALVYPVQFMRIFTTNEAVVHHGERFLRIAGYSFLPMGISNATMIILRAVGSARPALAISSASLFTNVFFNWVFIFGNLGAPAFGVEGAAIATCITRALEVCIAITYMAVFEKKICYRLRYLFMRRLYVAREFMRHAFPVLLNELLWASGMALVAVIIGRMGTEFTAAYSICQVLGQLASGFMMGIGTAAAVIIGNTVGAGEYKRAAELARVLQILSIGMGLVSFVVVFLLRDPLIGLYQISPLAKAYASQMISILAVIVVFQSYAITALVGVLRGGGDGRFVFLVDVGFIWAVSIPLGFLAGLYLQWPIPLVYAIIRSDEILKCISTALRIRKGEWMNDVTIHMS